jgi:hypothetical protein
MVSEFTVLTPIGEPTFLYIDDISLAYILRGSPSPLQNLRNAIFLFYRGIFRIFRYYLCTGALLYVRYSFLLISKKFCDLSLLHSVGGQCGKKKLMGWAPSHFPKAQLWALKAQIQYIKQKIATFWGPKRLNSISQGQKKYRFQGQTPPTCPRNGFARTKSITYGAV